MENERLARLEEKFDGMAENLTKFMVAQDQHNSAFYASKLDYEKSKASAKGIWWAFGFLGALTMAVSGFVSWMVAQFGVGK